MAESQSHKSKQKFVTEAVEEVLSKALQGENVDAMLASLTPYGRKIWEDMLTQFRQSGDSELLEQLNVADYIEKPPTMREFLEDPYYLGGLMVKSPDSEGLFPAWHEILCRDFDFDSTIHNCVLTGSLGSGKTFVMVTIVLYRVLIATLLRNPHNFFGLTKGTRIVFNLLSITKAAVTETAFGDAMNFMANSPYFLEECNYNPDFNYTNYRIPLKNAILLTAGSKGQHILGRNIIGVGLDEGNWRLEADPDTKAYELYNEVRNRINNRFRKVAGYLPAISILASSAKDESSFTETIIKEIEATNDPLTQKVYRNSVYKIKRHTLQLGPRWFKVAYGLKNIIPCILAGWYNEQGGPYDADTHEAPPPGAMTELVPELYYQEFKRRPLNALRDVCGISTGGVNRWFATTIDIERCFELAERDGVVCPVLQGLEMIPLSMEDNRNLWDFLDHRVFLTRVQSQIIPKRHPQALRYAHIDLATQSMAGVAVCHLVGKSLVENLVRQGLPFSEYRLIVEYDFILTIIAGQVKPISLEKIQNFLIWLNTKCGYHFGKVTYDQFQCLTGDTLISTQRGLIPLADTVKGDTVQSCHGLKKVTDTYRYTQAPVIRITTNRGSTLCGTPNHRIAADQDPKPWKPLQFQWICLDQLKPGDAVQMLEKPVEMDCENAQMLPPKEKTPQDSALPFWVFPTSMTPSLALLIGLYWGDGSVSAGHGIRMTTHADDLNDTIKLLAGLGLPTKSYKYKKSQCYAVNVHSARLADWLLKNGLSKNTAKGRSGCDLQVPSKILQSNRASKAAFLQGLFSTDGSVDLNDGAVTFSTCYFKLAHQVSILLRTDFGIKSTIIKSNREGFGKIRMQYIVRLRGRRTDFFEKIGFCLQRKIKALIPHLKRPGRELKERIKFITYGTEDVFDLQVENSHSYVANGFVSHNSEQALQMLEARGFQTDRQSVDRNKDAYINWRMAFEELRLRPYRHRHMLHEAENLLDTEKKVEKGPNGSKDTTDACLDKSTLLMTPGCKLVELGSLKEGESLRVYSWTDDGFETAQAIALGTTRKNADLVRVTLDNGKSVICTPDHLFLRRWDGGGYIRADQLKPGLVLLPFRYYDRIAVVSVEPAGAADTTCLRVTGANNFALATGIFVHNCAGAYNNAINSEEKSTILVPDNPRLHGTHELEGFLQEPPPIDIPLPLGATRAKTFNV